nr:class I SAM-dependent methyltransferase [Myxococcales bacterium]
MRMGETDPNAAWQLRSWSTNADAWAAAIHQGAIESRGVTNQAIVEVVVALQPRRVLDVGCGEGWLVRALAEHGIEGIGLDATEGLIRHARALGAGEFRVTSYDEVVGGAVDDVTADVIVSNFALVDEE